jgi:phosphoheptose isomerase
MTGFPVRRYRHALDFLYDYREEMEYAFISVSSEQFGKAADVLRTAYRSGARVFTCGNGGSASIANHLVCDHVKGIRNGTELAPRVVSLTSNVELLTAIANDSCYGVVFSDQLEYLASPGDVLVAISSSGKSDNVCNALQWANAHGMQTIAFTGFDGGTAYQIAQIQLHVNSHNYGAVEDAHQAVMHALAQFIRQAELPPETSIEEITF